VCVISTGSTAQCRQHGDAYLLLLLLCFLLLLVLLLHLLLLSLLIRVLLLHMLLLSLLILVLLLHVLLLLQDVGFTGWDNETLNAYFHSHIPRAVSGRAGGVLSENAYSKQGIWVEPDAWHRDSLWL
jgi:hypothetical protein